MHTIIRNVVKKRTQFSLSSFAVPLTQLRIYINNCRRFGALVSCTRGFFYSTMKLLRITCNFIFVYVRNEFICSQKFSIK